MPLVKMAQHIKSTSEILLLGNWRFKPPNKFETLCFIAASYT